jgi:hypothetical protein
MITLDAMTSQAFTGGLLADLVNNRKLGRPRTGARNAIALQPPCLISRRQQSGAQVAEMNRCHPKYQDSGRLMDQGQALIGSPGMETHPNRCKALRPPR